MTGEVLHLIHERNFCLRRFKKTKCTEWYEKYKTLRNQVQNKKVVAKSEYIVNKVEESENQPRKLWQTLTNLGTSSKLKTNSKNVGLKIGNEICFDKFKVAEKFNNFYSTVASSLLTKLPTGSGKYGFDHGKQYYSNANGSNVSFMFQPVTDENVFNILQSLNSNKATGLDKFPPRFLKDGAKFITAPLTYIINLSISQGKIPSELKSAKITPI